MSATEWRLNKRPTGIPGLDELTHGGLPANEATLLLGDTGTGKTVLALQILAHAVAAGDGGIFVSFEESPDQLKRNADSFDWGKALVDSEGWASIDARSMIGAEFAGAFDIDGLLSMIEAQAQTLEAPWIILDGIDQLLQHQPQPQLAVEQIRRLNERCESNRWTLLLTGKRDSSERLTPHNLEGVEFMLPTMVLLSARVIDGGLGRFMRIAKYRGSSHVTDEVPMVMTDHGVTLPSVYRPQSERPFEADERRVSSGIESLDQVLDGGPHRGSSMLISGRPGTAKTTLAAAFAEAAADRGERTLIVSFDELEGPFVRNLKSVGIDLGPLIDKGVVRFLELSATSGVNIESLLAIAEELEDFDPSLLMIDPVSALMRKGNSVGSGPAVGWLLHRTRASGVTTLMTSLSNEIDPEGEATVDKVSTIADTWIALDYNVRGGERNRSLSVVKSRGTAHSNQQRELLLTSEGLELVDIFEYGTEVLMGTARMQKQSEEQFKVRRTNIEAQRRRQDLERRIEQAHSEVERLNAELELQAQEDKQTLQLEQQFMQRVRQQRTHMGSSDDSGSQTT